MHPDHVQGLRTIEDISTDKLAFRVRELLDQGARLALVAAHHDRDALRVVYLFVRGAPDTRTELHVRLDPNNPTLPTLAALSFPASRFEREMHDLHGITPLDHPLPRRLIRHDHWPRGWYPLRPDAPPPPAFGSPEGPFPFLTVEGEGVHEIPVGPVHAGLIEPGHFRFSVVGETIIKLQTRLWYVHKGIERLFQGRDLSSGLALAERISGDTAVGHALAYCLAVEEATGTIVPPPAHYARALLLELERLYNHITDIGALCNDVGHSILNAHALRIREQLLRLNQAVTGHRLLRGGVLPGGATLRELPSVHDLEAIGADITEVVDLALNHSMIRDRFTGTARLSPTAARDLGCLGYVARASGLDVDARLTNPFYDAGNALTVPTHLTGDVLARFRLRADETAASLALMHHLLRHVHPGTVRAPVAPSNTSTASGVGLVEGWRGTIATRVEIDTNQTLTRVKPVDPSFFNWPALPIALTDTIVPDFPLANKSFNLSYAGNDL